jgi:hypothetical protein
MMASLTRFDYITPMTDALKSSLKPPRLPSRRRNIGNSSGAALSTAIRTLRMSFITREMVDREAEKLAKDKK